MADKNIFLVHIVLSKLIYNTLKFIIKPAHKLDIGILQHILCFTGSSHGIQRIIYGICYILPLKLIHSGQPFSKTHKNKTYIHLKFHSHDLIII